MDCYIGCCICKISLNFALSTGISKALKGRGVYVKMVRVLGVLWTTIAYGQSLSELSGVSTDMEIRL